MEERSKRVESPVEERAKRVESLVKDRAKRVESLVQVCAKRVNSLVKERAKRLDSIVKERAKRVENPVTQWVWYPYPDRPLSRKNIEMIALLLNYINSRLLLQGYIFDQTAGFPQI